MCKLFSFQNDEDVAKKLELELDRLLKSNYEGISKTLRLLRTDVASMRRQQLMVSCWKNIIITHFVRERIVEYLFYVVNVIKLFFGLNLDFHKLKN